jgi:hypothetical protein
MSSSSTEIKQIKKFGVIGMFFFAVLCAISVWRERTVLVFIFGILLSLSIGFFLVPGPLAPVYRGWLKASHFMGRVTTLVVLTLAYYLVITPTALVKRAIGGRPLPTSPDKTASSYWVFRSEQAQPKERFIKRY